MGKMLQKKKLKENDVLLFTASKYTQYVIQIPNNDISIYLRKMTEQHFYWSPQLANSSIYQKKQIKEVFPACSPCVCMCSLWVVQLPSFNC